MRKTLLLLMVICAAIWLFGFDIETSVSLKGDLSGKASVRVTADIEGFLQGMAGIWRHMPGFKAPTPAEIHQRALAVVAAAAAKKPEDLERQRAELGKSLPPGVKLASIALQYQGTTMLSQLDFDFDDVRKLWQIQLPQSPNNLLQPGAASRPASQATKAADSSSEAADPRSLPYRDFYDRPFYGLVVNDMSTMVSVMVTFANPVAFARLVVPKQGTIPARDEALRPFEGSRFIFKLDSPLAVHETNATRHDEHSLLWEIHVADPDAKTQEILVAFLKR
jgi:hypothetical protein